MALITSESGSVTLTRDRLSTAMEAAWEIEALAYTLPDVTTNCTTAAYQSGLVVRGIASRIVMLSEALAAALSDREVSTEELTRRVSVVSLDRVNP